MVAAVQLVANGAVAAAGGSQAGGDEAKAGDGFSALLSAVSGEVAGAVPAGLAAQAEALVRENITDGKDILMQAAAIAVAAPVQPLQHARALNDVVLDGAELVPGLPVNLSQEAPLDPGAQLPDTPGQAVAQNGLQIADEAAVADAPVPDLTSPENAIIAETEKGEAPQAAGAKTNGVPVVKSQASALIAPAPPVTAAPQAQVQSQAQSRAAPVSAERVPESSESAGSLAERTRQPLGEVAVKLVAANAPSVDQSRPAPAPIVSSQPQVATEAGAAASLAVVTGQGDADNRTSAVKAQDQNNAKPETESAPAPVMVSADVKGTAARNDAPSATPQTSQSSASAPEIVADSGAQSGGQQSAGGQQQGASQPSVTLPQPLSQQVYGNTGSAAPSHFAQHLAQASGVPVLDQVMVHLRNNQHDGSSRIQIQLEPAELGRLEIRLDVAADGKTGVTVTAESRAALETLQRDARGLERALNDAGLKTDSGSLSFNLRGEQQDHQQGRKQAQSYSKKSVQEEEELQAIGQIVSRSLALSVRDGLDIHI